MLLAERADILALTYAEVSEEFRTTSDAAAFAFCKRLARAHYENFPVGSLLIPRALQPHFFSVYAFARLADDVADELEDTSEKLAALERLETMVQMAEGNVGNIGKSENPIFRALRATMCLKSIPALPFQKLLTAFRRDSAFEAPRTLCDLERYSEYSANPVGELVLRMFDLYTPERAAFSDAICTGLQLANFWQDFSVDIPRGRVMIPQDILEAHDLTAEDFFALQETFIHRSATNSNAGTASERNRLLKKVTVGFLPCFDILFHATKMYFTHGKKLLPLVPHYRLRIELALTIAGGERMLVKAHSMGARALTGRPTLGKSDAFPILRTAIVHLFNAL